MGTLIFAELDMEHTLYGAARPLARPCRPGTPVVRVESPTAPRSLEYRGSPGFCSTPKCFASFTNPPRRLQPLRTTQWRQPARDRPPAAPPTARARTLRRVAMAALPRAPPLSQRSLHCYHHRLVSGIAGRLGGWLRTEGNNDIGRAPQDAHVQIGVPDGQVSLS